MFAGKAILVAVPAYIATMATVGAQPSGSYTHDPHMWGGWGWGGMILGPIMMILFIAAAVAVVVLVLRAFGVGPSRPAGGEGRTALNILNERFARGEIDKDDYEERKRALSD
jgi:putative membrane protein